MYKGSKLQNLAIRGEIPPGTMNLWLLCGQCHQVAAHVHIVHRIGGGSTALFTVNKQTDELAFLQAYVVRKSTTQKNTPFTKVSSVLERAKATGNTIHPSLGILGGPLLLGPFLFLGQPVSSNGEPACGGYALQ